MSIVKIQGNTKVENTNVNFVTPTLIWANFITPVTEWFLNEIYNSNLGFVDSEGFKVNSKKRITSINLSGPSSNLNKGGRITVSNFPSLSYLACNSLALTSLNLENLPSLTELRFGGNTLTNINFLTATPNIERAFFGGILGLTNADFSAYQMLKEINSSSSPLTSINFSNLQNLNILAVTNSLITNWNFSTNLPSLTSISIGGASTIFTNLDFSQLNAPNLQLLGLGNSYKLSAANFQNPLLSSVKTLNVNNSSLSSLNLQSFTGVQNLRIENTSETSPLYRNSLSSIDLTSTTSLIDFTGSRVFLRNLNVGNQPNCTRFVANNNLLSSLNVSGLGPNITALNLEFNSLTGINISNLPLCYANLRLRNNNLRGNLVGLNSLSAYTGAKNIYLQANNMTATHLNNYFQQLPTKTPELTGTWTVFIRNNTGTATATLSTATSKGWIVNTSST